jgi:hypothetical protein
MAGGGGTPPANVACVSPEAKLSGGRQLRSIEPGCAWEDKLDLRSGTGAASEAASRETTFARRRPQWYSAFRRRARWRLLHFTEFCLTCTRRGAAGALNLRIGLAAW